MHKHSYENEFNLHVNEISFSYERMSTKTRFKKEAKGNSEIAYCVFECFYQSSNSISDSYLSSCIKFCVVA